MLKRTLKNIKNYETSNLKYLTRCQYYGKLIDIEYVSEATVLIFQVYTATEFYGNKGTIRIYVPTDLENRINNNVVINEKYFIIAAPYKLTFAQNYKHRVDMLLNIFQEV